MDRYELECAVLEEYLKRLANEPKSEKRDYAAQILGVVADRLGMEAFGWSDENEELLPADQIKVYAR